MTDPKPKQDAALLAVLNDPNTLVIIQDGGIDAQVSERWLREIAPNVEKDGRLLSAFQVSQLQAPQSIVAVYRSMEQPALTYTMNQVTGTVHHAPRPDSELFREMVVTKPVKVGDHWDRPNPRAPGKVDVASFMSAVAESWLPMRPDARDKGEKKPDEYQMRPL